MKLLTVEEAADVYRCAQLCSYSRFKIVHSGFEAFCLGLRNFEYMLGASRYDEFWRSLTGRLRKYRFDAGSTPLPFNHPRLIAEEEIEALRSNATHCGLLFPEFAMCAEQIVNQFTSLACLNDNPLMKALVSTAPNQTGYGLAVLLKQSRFIDAVAAEFYEHEQVSSATAVLTSQLGGGQCYQKIAVVGPSRWFPDYVFLSPRAHEISVLNFSCIYDDQTFGPCFVASMGRGEESGGRKIVRFSNKNVRESHLGEHINAEEILPTVNWGHMSDRISSRGNNAGLEDEHDLSLARLFLLEDGLAVLLDAEEDASTLVIDTSETDESRVKRVRIQNIEPGLFVLVRVGDNVDYIVPLADKILGDESDVVREAQRNWKNRLRETVALNGMHEVVESLKREGGVRASPSNVRNWMSHRSIKTKDYEDFTAIMKYICIPEETEGYWLTMCAIDSAHRKAGQYIRRALIDKVAQSDLSDLDRLGMKEFDLPDLYDVSITAIRVLDSSPDKTLVFSSQIGRPFDAEDLE